MATRRFTRNTKLPRGLTPRPKTPKPQPKKPPPQLKKPPPKQPAPDAAAEIAILKGNLLQMLGAANSANVTARAEAGKTLIEIQKRVPYGSWSDYLARELPYDPRTAQRAMQLHYFRVNQPTLFEQVAKLELAQAYVLVRFPASIITQLVTKAHVIPSTGHKKVPQQMSFDEMFEVIAELTPSKPAPIADDPLYLVYRKQVRDLVKTLKKLSATRPAIPDDKLADLYDDLVIAVAQFALAYALEDQSN